MVTIEVFSTLREAEKELNIYFSKNRDVAYNIANELQARLTVYQQSADYARRHMGNKNAPPMTTELLMLCNGLGQGEGVTPLIKLYAVGHLHNYGFDYAQFDPTDPEIFLPYSSISELVGKIRQTEQSDEGNMGLEKYPLFYTVLEPFTYSEKDKQKVRKEMRYETMPFKDKEFLDHILESWFERALTPAEIKEFASNYAKFFN